MPEELKKNESTRKPFDCDALEVHKQRFVLELYRSLGNQNIKSVGRLGERACCGCRKRVVGRRSLLESLLLKSTGFAFTISKGLKKLWDRIVRRNMGRTGKEGDNSRHRGDEVQGLRNGRKRESLLGRQCSGAQKKGRDQRFSLKAYH